MIIALDCFLNFTKIYLFLNSIQIFICFLKLDTYNPERIMVIFLRANRFFQFTFFTLKILSLWILNKSEILNHVLILNKILRFNNQSILTSLQKVKHRQINYLNLLNISKLILLFSVKYFMLIFLIDFGGQWL